MADRSGGRRRGRRKRPRRDRKVELERYRSIVPDFERFLGVAQTPEPTVIRVRSGRIGEQELVDRLEGQGFRLEPIEGLPGFRRVVQEPRPLSATVEHWLGLFYIQQASTGVAAPELGPRPGERVLDLCSAPGGKTTHMAELMEDTGCLVASEISEPRIRGLLGNIYRLGHPNILAVASDGRDFPTGPLFDRVLIDAPCSGEGTLRRRAGSAPDQSATFLRYVSRIQKRLLARAAELVRPGGDILYVTCTFSPDENEAVLDEALKTLPLELVPLELGVPHERGLTSFEGCDFDPRVEGAARIYPHHFDSGGLFLAKLRRLGSEPRTDAGWSAPPTIFPAPEDADAAAEVAERIGPALEELEERWGIRPPPETRWIVRGGRAWAHSCAEWPLEAWEPGEWRGLSLGLRAIEFDSKKRPRWTNDLVRWAPPAAGRPVTPEELGSLLGGERLEAEGEPAGPTVLRMGDDVIGRGAVGVGGLRSEIPRARAVDLQRALSAD